MKVGRGQSRTWMLVAVAAALLGLFAWVVLRAGPMAPVAVTVAEVEQAALAPALFGIGNVEARHVHRIGPTVAGRLEALDVEVGDTVRAGQRLGRMAPVDLADRQRAAAAAGQQARAMLAEARARQAHAMAQWRRYEALGQGQYVSADAISARRQEAQVANAAVQVAEQAVAQARAEAAAVSSQLANLDLVSPVDGVVALRSVDPGTSVVAGQTVVEVIDPGEVWVSARFDQAGAAGLAAGLPARIVLRSHGDASLQARVLRVEPKADAVTEEMMAKVAFAVPPQPLPPVGELAEVTVMLPQRAPAAVVPNGALHRVDGQVGIWKVAGGRAAFVPVVVGASDLAGQVEVTRGVRAGDRIVVYSEKPLTARSRLKTVERLAGAR